MQTILPKNLWSFLAVMSLLMTTWLANPLKAQPGTLDPTFNVADVGFGSGDGPNGAIISQVVLPDGKIVIGGFFTTYGGQIRSGVARLNADGTLDNTFNPGTGTNAGVYGVAVQSDGKVIIVGEFTTFNGAPRNRVARINADGSVDNTFNVGSGANDTMWAVGIQSNGKIIIGGEMTSYNGTAVSRVARLNTDGSLDATFNPGGAGPSSDVLTISVGSDNKIVIGGLFVQYNATARSGFARLNSDGTLDATFNIGAGANGPVVSSAIQSDGKVLIGGAFTSLAGTANINRIARLNADGSRDATFNIGSGVNNLVWSLAVQADGKVLAGGDFTTFNGNPQNRLVRLSSNGSLDNTLNIGAGFTSAVYAINLQSNGKIVVGGAFGFYNNLYTLALAQLNSNGSLDTDFNKGTGFNNDIFASLIQTDGKIYLGGRFGKFNGAYKFGLVRVNADGSLDNTFDTGTGPNNSILSIAQQSDGKIIIGGFFTTYNGTAINRLARLNANGSLDATFNIGTGANSNSVTGVLVQPDGKIMIVGAFSQFNGQPRNQIARLNADGSVDGTFNPGSGGTDGLTMNAIARQSDGKYIVGGSFTSYNGTPRNRIVRINADGSLDNTFNPGSGFGDGVVRTLAIQPDGKIIVGGSFTSFNGSPAGRVVRLNADGSLDATFNVGSGAGENFVFSSQLFADGRVLLAGSFFQFNGAPVGNLVMLNPNGSVDATFQTGTGASGPNSSIATTAVQADGKIIIAGNFNQYNGVGKNRAARINGINTSTGIAGVNQLKSFQAAVYPNPSNGTFNLSVEPTVAGEYTMMVVDMSGRFIQTETINLQTGTQIIPMRLDVPGMYVVSLQNEQHRAFARVVVQ